MSEPTKAAMRLAEVAIDAYETARQDEAYGAPVNAEMEVAQAIDDAGLRDAMELIHELTTEHGGTLNSKWVEREAYKLKTKLEGSDDRI